MTTTNDDNSSSTPTKLKIITDIFSNLPEELANFKRIPCAMSSIYTGIIGGTLTATLALVSTGRLSSLKFGVLGYLGSSMTSWHWCRYKLKNK